MGQLDLFWVLRSRPLVSYREFINLGKGEFSGKCFNLVEGVLSIGVLGVL